MDHDRQAITCHFADFREPGPTGPHRPGQNAVASRLPASPAGLRGSASEVHSGRYPPVHSASESASTLGSAHQLFGDHSGEETPGNISNPEAKLASADGTARGASWESRSSPNALQRAAPPNCGAALSSRQVLAVRTQEAFPVEVDQVRWVVSAPNIGLPGNFLQVLAQFDPRRQCRDEDEAGR